MELKKFRKYCKGNFVSLDYKKVNLKNNFIAINKKDINKSPTSIKVELLSDSLNSISNKSKIYYKNIEIGKVDDYF